MSLIEKLSDGDNNFEKTVLAIAIIIFVMLFVTIGMFKDQETQHYIQFVAGELLTFAAICLGIGAYSTVGKSKAKSE